MQLQAMLLSRVIKYGTGMPHTSIFSAYLSFIQTLVYSRTSSLDIFLLDAQGHNDESPLKHCPTFVEGVGWQVYIVTP
jgi:hypothetical protein